jgi:SAM-dependent methyltransferase
MLLEEAKWLSDVMSRMEPSRIYPLLNIGSSTDQFRKVTQPWIDHYLFLPARKKGLVVVHSDIKEADGVDLVGDLTDKSFLQRLMGMKFKSILCANLLEHVTNKEEICTAIETIVEPGGYIFVTCPYSYPYHPDPIDTGYRPTPEELAQLFPHSCLKQAEILNCGSHLKRLIERPSLLAFTLLRLFMPFYKPRNWWQHVRLQSWIVKTFKVSCVLLEKQRPKVSV